MTIMLWITNDLFFIMLGYVLCCGTAIHMENVKKRKTADRQKLEWQKKNPGQPVIYTEESILKK